MANPWEAEVPLTAELAKRLIDEQFPELSPASLERLSAGWDNTVWLVNGTYVFRFPRRQLGADCLEVEVVVLPQIADRLPLPISNPTMIGKPAGNYPWLFAGYPLLIGKNACDAQLTIEDRIRLAKPLGEFLHALHSVSGKQALRIGAPHDTLSRLDVQKREAKTREQLKLAVDRRFVNDPTPYELMIEEALSATVTASPALVHGDLYGLHLLLNDDRQLTGVIDWGDVHAGNIAVDLMIALSLLPPAGQRVFFEVYGKVDDATLRLARFRALYHALVLVLYAEEIGHDALMQEAIQGLDFLAIS